MAIAMVAGFAGSVRAQSFTEVNLGPMVQAGYPIQTSASVNPTTDLVSVTRPTSCAAETVGGVQTCNGAGYSLPLSAFASAHDLATVNAGVTSLAQGLGATNANIASLTQGLATANAGIASLNTAIKGVNTAISHNRTLALQGIAMASAFTITAPNPGDRFSISIGGSSYFGEAAGSIGVSYRAAPNVVVFVGAAQSANQSLFKGGMSVSLP